MAPTHLEIESFQERQAIKAALMPYIEGAISGDAKKCVSTMMDHVRVVGSVGGEFSTPDKTAFAAEVAKLGASPNLKYEITWMDISGPAAAARVEFLDWAGLRFTDFFVLYKEENGAWKISGKVYDSHSNN